MTAESSAKFRALVNYLQEIGVKKGADRRAVVFSERVPTLHWLQKNLTKYLELPKGAVKVMHGGLPEEEQLALIDEFKRADTPLRILVTGDVASEGVNLHAQCHHLIHYDIPWSLIRIQQRNGRIDRYGQEHSPQITALLLDPQGADSIGEIRVLTRLIERENEANELLGDAALLMGEHKISAEEDKIRSVLSGQRDIDDVVRDPESITAEARDRARGTHAAGGRHASNEPAPAPAPASTPTTPSDDSEGHSPSHGQGRHAAVEDTDTHAESDDELDLMALLMADGGLAGITGADTTATSTSDAGITGTDTPNTAPHARRTGFPSLYREEFDYLEDALNEAFHGEPNAPLQAGGVNLVEHDNDTVEMTPPRDLQRRFDYLPQDYVDYRRVNERLQLATSERRGDEQLRAAREGDSQKSWPKAHFLGPLHPVSDWAADRALAAMGRSEIPAVLGSVTEPTVFLMGTLTNSRGQVVSRVFVAATAGPFGLDAPEGVPGATVESLEDPYRWLRDAGLDSQAINPGHFALPHDVNALVQESVKAAENRLDSVHSVAADRAKDRTNAWMKRKMDWESDNSRLRNGQQSLTIARSEKLIAEEEELLRAMMPERVLVRPLCVILPRT